ncbi:2-oxoacid:ferredoxin oxidoreductase subunit beta [Luminiphilus sp.]|mgnify:FL=1|nr:2-oxoacid:ferredoxin oxidoreductase subunit beta [Luminiphilus sp.]MDA8659464.1 2-oxoacid:ferredoxin oxidoreductase subunit beta [Luminiphilus sp.]MDA9580824.1 2-oxoacid:ferredoxin oxidoreductase subunit beta [Luminiphilus sp.]MDB2352883.1 2-oxoacid:ferredoxin oxidoreductase subunit beta [Luminiphilus sp.]MDC3405366.1 2-oxoacid:ferredoxin oxidoreductase subunit beta [Luminiphilus sp.]
MTFVKPAFRHPDAPRNELGRSRQDYEGGLSTLCAGCGHDSVSAAIIDACFELNIEPHKVAKLSGIGCSSKTPAYFLSGSHSFNSVHGRMPSVATGANLANRDLIYIGISGDGDTASIGLGQFAHVVRRNLNMTYIVENNGCYGLTKGQDSATMDTGTPNKKGDLNMYSPIDLARLAIEIGATFVGRSFSGDKQQLIPLIKAAISHRGFALLDVVSPCVTFNNHGESTKSYEHMRSANTDMPVDFVPMRQEITATYDSGATCEVCMHDGSVVRLYKQDNDYDIEDRQSALEATSHYAKEGKILTGLLYIQRDSEELHDVLDTARRPLNSMNEQQLCPGPRFLDSINAGLR